VLADAFELYANATERALLLRDFYGPEARLGSFTAGSKEDVEKTRKGLPGLLEGADPERRRRILNSVQENLLSMWVYCRLSPPTYLLSALAIDSTTRTRVR
jgi:pumilio homology domain family member 6